MRFLDQGLSNVRGGASLQQAAQNLVEHWAASSASPPPGFGHRLHTQDPRAPRLFQLVTELELEGEHVLMLRAIEHALTARQPHFGRLLPANVDGAIAAISADLGFSYELGHAIFLISRLPGLIAHAHEERMRQQPMRRIDPKDHVYDGAAERRLPEGRK
jgi:citrate synthase